MIKKQSYSNLVAFILFTYYIIWGYLTVPIIIHWDESKLIDSVISQYHQGKFLPQWYNYPSVIFYISYFNYFIWENFLYKTIINFNYFNRWIFYIICGLPFWIIYNHFKEKNYNLIALILAIIWFSSWEFHYHSRWVAPDALVASFGMISILYLSKNKNSNWWIATLFAAITMGTKYTGGIFLIPILIKHVGASIKKTIIKWTKIILLFSLFFLITTPGLILDTEKCLADIRYEQIHYSTGHYNYTIKSGLFHLSQIIIYIFQIPSPCISLNFFIISASIVGIVYMIWKKNHLTLIALLTSIIFYVIFMSFQKVMFARNLILLWPFIVFFSTNGINEILNLKKTTLNIFWILLIISSTLIVFFYDTTILSFDKTKQVKNFAKYINYNNNHKYKFSKKVLEELDKANIKLTQINNKKNSDNLYYVFFLSEANQRKLPSNKYNWIKKDFGPKDVNLNYYPTWQNNNRIIVVNENNLINNADIEFLE